MARQIFGGGTQGFGGRRPPLPREGWTGLEADDNIKPGTAVRWCPREGEDGFGGG
jgi:hypothetical protein